MRKRVYTRPQAENEFVHALTRQVGYTAGAFSIKRMAGIVEQFDDANAYQFELVKRLESVSPSTEKLKEKYATDILNFASELGIIGRLPGASAPHLSRFVLTDAGVAIRAARAVAPDLERLVLEHLILESDADAYLRILGLLKEDGGRSNEELGSDFRELVFASRQARLAWLRAAFPSRAILMRLVKSGPAQVHWLRQKRLGVIEAEKPSADFGRHHFGPRKSWALELNHLDPESKGLTRAGIDFLSIGQYDGPPEKHWISPPPECLSFLRISSVGSLHGPSAPTFDLLRPATFSSPPSSTVVGLCAEFLRVAFPHIRLVHARQAPTSPLKYYLLSHERETGCRYELDVVLNELARTMAGEFAFFSSRSGSLAYYQLRSANSNA